MNSNPKVSIIIPVYNTEKNLNQCLDSVVNQTFKDIEIICVNDCSTDNSLNILKNFALKDKRINIIDLKENKGVSNARNSGLNSAKAEFIVFIDGDDWVTTDHIEILYNQIKKYNTDFVCSDFYTYDNKNILNTGIYVDVTYNKIINSEKDKRIYLQYLKYLSLSQVWAKIFRKSFIINNNLSFQQLRSHEDNLFMWEAIIKANGFVFVKNKIYYYRNKRIESLTNTNTINDKISFFKILYLLNQNYYKKYLSDFYTYISVDICYYIEKASAQDAKKFFIDFKTLFYNKNFKLTYKFINIRNKIRLFIFSCCLKYNINYALIGKFHHKFNPIRLFTKKKNL